MALPRSEEAREMKDDMGDQALTDAEGYEFKRMHVSSELAAESAAGVPIFFSTSRPMMPPRSVVTCSHS